MKNRPHIPSAQEITGLHDENLVKWKKDGDYQTETRDLIGWIEENHLRNFRLWQAEDKARREDRGFEYVYHAKRAIDSFNQQRNDFIEKMDAWLVRVLNPPQTDCAFNSETPGMMIDRLSILALKIHHMRLQAERTDASEDHREACSRKLAILTRQRKDLSECLDTLMQEAREGSRSFRVYYQFKMYNDPKLNPELYAPGRPKGSTGNINF